VAPARDRDRSESAVPAAVAAAAVPPQFAHTESSARLGEPGTQPGLPDASFDRQLVRQLFAHLNADPDVAMKYFYARLFADNPGLRGLFPYTMTQTRAAVFGMLASLVRNLDDEGETQRALGQLARDHRKYGVKEKHYQPFFAALVAMAEHVGGKVLTAEMAVAWRKALDYFAAVMAAAAADDARSQPAWWTGEVVQHDRRTETVAVLTIRPDRPLKYAAGQYIDVQAPRWPRTWRRYSIANAPRENGLIDIHVRAVPGGLVSNALVSHCAAGDAVLLSSARGDMAVPADPARDLVCVGGGTGLAPVKSIIEEVVGAARPGRRRAITLYVGVRRSRDLYDMRDLETLRLAYPSLTVIPVAEHELDFSGRVGRLPDVVWTHPSFRDCDVFVAGPAGMVSATVQALSRRVPGDRLHHDPLEALRLARRPPLPDALGQPVPES
jgi:NAD(P)H-flavin reductase/hemoglobin-like flavoprotein